MKSRIGLYLLLGVAATARATMLTWDADTTMPEAQDGSGIWDAVNVKWWNTTNSPWNSVTPDSAIFGNGGTAGVVSLGAAITVSAIVFNAIGSGEYLIQGGTLTLSSGSSIVAHTNATISSELAGAGLVKSGGGVLTLSGASTYAGGTTVDGGTLNISGGSVIGTLNLISHSGSTVVITNGVLTLSTSATGVFGVGYGATSSGTLTVAQGGVANIGHGGGRTFVGGGPSGGPYGTGILNLNAGGTVNVAAAGTFPNDQIYLAGYGGTGTINFAGGTLATRRGVASGGVPAINILAGGAIIDDLGSNLTFGVGWSNGGGGGGVAKYGNGTLSLNAKSSFTGPLVIHAGTLRLKGGDNANWLSGNPNVVVNSGATLAFSDYNTFGTNIASMSTVTVFSGGTILSSGKVTCFNNLTLNGATISINGADNYGTAWGSFGFGGTTTATSNSLITVVTTNTGTISVGNGNTPTFKVNTPSTSDSLTVSAVMQHSLALIKQGNGTLTLTASNKYTGGTTVTGGILVVTGGGSLNGTLSLITQAGGAAIVSNGSVTLAANTGGVMGVGYAALGTGSLTVANSVLNAGNGGGRTFIGGGNGTAPFGTGVMTINAGGRVNIAAPGSFPNERLYFAGYGGAGTIHLNSGGILSSARDIVVGSGVAAAGVLNFNGGTLKAGTGYVAQSGFLTGQMTVNILAGGAIVDTTNHSLTFVPPLLTGGAGNDGGLTKLGAGTLQLSGASTFTNLTTVSNGTLLVNGSLAGPVHVAAGGTLGGAGVVKGAVMVDGTLSPGNAVGTLTVSNHLTLGAGAVVAYSLGASSDRTVVYGNLTLGGTLNVTNAGTLSIGSSFVLFTYSGVLSGALNIGTMPEGYLGELDTNTAGVVKLKVDSPSHTTLTAFPKSMQLYPRDLQTGRAIVPVSGVVLAPGFDQINLVVLRSGVPYTNIAYSLDYQGDQAVFSLAVPLVAELAGYDFTLQAMSNGTPYLVATETNVVAGDVVLVNGQSNAEARQFNGSANSNQSSYLRSFGYRSATGSEVLADPTWHLAEGDAIHGPGAVGQWALRMGRVLIASNGIPLAIINHAEGGRPISYFQRNDSDPANPAINYGQMLYRVQQAGLQSAVRAILWYQGESDNDAAAVHESGFLTLYRNWLRDYPMVEKVYVFQLHVGCGTTQWGGDLRNRQRLWADQYPRMRVVSTTGLPGHDGCHYAYQTGYRILGENVAGLIRRDLYSASVPSVITPPNIAFAYFSDASGTNVTVVLRNPDDAISAGAGVAAEFRMEGLTNAVVTTLLASSNRLELTFDRDVRTGSGLTYAGHSGAGPLITNQAGLGLLTFHNQPVAASLAFPDMPVGLQAFPIASNRIDLSWAAVTGVANYLVRRDGVIVGTPVQTFFIDETLTPGPTYLYDVAAMNPAGTSAWSVAVATSTVPYNVFRHVPEAQDYELLYRLNIPTDLAAGSTLNVSYDLDRSMLYTQGIRRVAYFLEIQDQPGRALRWAYASMDTFSANPVLLGIPVALKGTVWQTNVANMNVFASPRTAVTPGLHLASGNIEFWGLNYAASNAAGVPNANNSLYDSGDQASTGGYYGSMQIHNHAILGNTTEVIIAYNHWGASGVDDVGIGNFTGAQPDWTFAANAVSTSVRRLDILVLRDVNTNGIPDAWEMSRLGSLAEAASDDHDSDGVSNHGEYLAGTDPANGNDWPRVLVEMPAGLTRVVVTTSVGRVYHLQMSTSLVDAVWTDTGGSFQGTGGRISLPVTNNSPAAGFRFRAATP